MADLLQCDVCKVISPDIKGLFIANHWLELSVTPRASGIGRYEKKYLVCDKCIDSGISISSKGVTP